MTDDFQMIDRSKCTLPEGHRLYKVSLTYGDKPWNVYASAISEKQAKELCKDLYDYMGKSLRVLSVDLIGVDSTTEYDRTKMSIIGALNIKEEIIMGTFRKDDVKIPQNTKGDKGNEYNG